MQEVKGNGAARAAGNEVGAREKSQGLGPSDFHVIAAIGEYVLGLKSQAARLDMEECQIIQNPVPNRNGSFDLFMVCSNREAVEGALQQYIFWRYENVLIERNPVELTSTHIQNYTAVLQDLEKAGEIGAEEIASHQISLAASMMVDIKGKPFQLGLTPGSMIAGFRIWTDENGRNWVEFRAGNANQASAGDAYRFDLVTGEVHERNAAGTFDSRKANISDLTLLRTMARPVLEGCRELMEAYRR